MELIPTKVVIIHDDITIKDPLIFLLQEKYGNDNVLLYKKSQDGIDYVSSHLSQKMIVILDLNFKGDEPSGVEVFQKIRSQTSLVYVIIMTASDVNSIHNEDLINFINNDALALEYSTTEYEKILKLVDKAAHQLEVRVDSVLEEWLARQSPEDLDKPYLTTRDGKHYTLNDILQSIRHGEPLGQKIERNILKLSVDLLSRQKKTLDD
jgi:DNA-binding NtrC family response regulator